MEKLNIVFIVVVITVIITSIISCNKLISQPDLIHGNWSLVNSNDLADEFYQIKITENYIERLFFHTGILRDSNLLEEGKILFSNQYPVSLKLVNQNQLEISDGQTVHLLKRIESNCYCFCIDGNYQSQRFNYKINQISENDSLEIVKLKEEIWDYFRGDINFENNEIKDFNFEVKSKRNKN